MLNNVMGPAAVSLTLSSTATLINYMVGCIVVLSHFHFDVAPFSFCAFSIQQVLYNSTYTLNYQIEPCGRWGSNERQLKTCINQPLSSAMYCFLERLWFGVTLIFHLIGGLISFGRTRKVAGGNYLLQKCWQVAVSLTGTDICFLSCSEFL